MFKTNRKCANNAKLLNEAKRRFMSFAMKIQDTNKDKESQRTFMEFKNVFKYSRIQKNISFERYLTITI